jgi:hypothetical protein
VARSRTRLTGGGDDLESSARGPSELYSPGLALPQEPYVVSPWRRRAIVLVTLLVVVVGLVATYRLVTSGQDFDPALTEQPGSPAPDPGS